MPIRAHKIKMAESILRGETPGLKDKTNPRQRYLDWSITVNNYTDHDVDCIRSAFATCEALYACIGKEVGACGTPHLQAHISFRGQGKRRSEASKLIPRARLSAVQHLTSHITHCQKEGDFEELGAQPDERSVRRKRGQSDEYENARTAIKGGMVNSPDLRSACPNAWHSHERTLRQFTCDARPPPEHGIKELYPWQRELLERLNETPHPRKIVFYIDHNGRAGKTTFLKYLLAEHHEKKDVQFFDTGKKENICHSLRTTTKIFAFDVPRTGAQHMNCGVLESIKNGLVFSPKHDSQDKMFPIPHVLVFLNDDPVEVDPETNKRTLSEDRWDKTFIEDPNPPPAMRNLTQSFEDEA